MLRELCLHPERRGGESLPGLCALLAASHEERALLCVCPTDEAPETLRAIRARYAPDLTILVKTPSNADALASAAPRTAAFPIGEKALLQPFRDGIPGPQTLL